ncbi:MAG: mechanosensitive ion channel family protein [Bifidobacteriaceae bacterium]|jgi:small conductance mechanosensitive channel|nr:mechanosensitive ion channel family protein [Bifidobacteriaceae bacterium]
MYGAISEALVGGLGRGALEGAAASVLPAAPAFTEGWPDWAIWLIDKPAQIVLILLAAVLLVAIGHAVVGKITERIVTGSRGGDDPTAAGYAAERRAARARTARSVLRSLVTVVVWVVAAALILERLGVNVAVLVTSIGVVGVGLGLGAQTLIKDMIAGLFMIVEDQYGIGDVIDIGPATGRVVNVSLRVTTLEDDDGVLWYVPNGTVTRIANQTQAAPKTPGGAAG